MPKNYTSDVYPDVSYNYAQPENWYQPPPVDIQNTSGPSYIGGAFVAAVTQIPASAAAALIPHDPMTSTTAIDLSPPVPKGFITMVTPSGQVYSVDCFDLSSSPEAPYRS